MRHVIMKLLVKILGIKLRCIFWHSFSDQPLGCLSPRKVKHRVFANVLQQMRSISYSLWFKQVWIPEYLGSCLGWQAKAHLQYLKLPS